MNSVLKLQNLSVGYKQSVIEDINLTVKKGELIALIGLNGSGKSTLLKNIAGILKPLGGQIFVQDVEIQRFTANQLAKRVSFASFSAMQKADITVKDFVALGRLPYTTLLGRLKYIDNQAVTDALRDCNIEAIANRRISQISDGQRQRVYIARLLAQQTPLLLLDEPTAFLDIVAKVEMINFFARISRELGKIVIFSTHDLKNAVFFASKFWIIHRKKIISGTPEDLIIQGKLQKVFETNSVKFNNLTADFYVQNTGKKKIRLIRNGDDLRNFWTETALLKAGFAIDNSAKIIVEVSQKGWQVKKAGNIMKMNKLEKLLEII